MTARHINPARYLTTDAGELAIQIFGYNKTSGKPSGDRIELSGLAGVFHSKVGRYHKNLNEIRDMLAPLYAAGAIVDYTHQFNLHGHNRPAWGEANAVKLTPAGLAMINADAAARYEAGHAAQVAANEALAAQVAAKAAAKAAKAAAKAAKVA